MVAQDLAHELAALERLDGLAEVARQALGTAALQLVKGDVGLRWELQALLDAAHTRGQRHGNREVGVARGIGAAQLDATRQLLARLVRGHAHERRAVLGAPGGVARDLAVGHEALVGVDRGVGDERVLRRVGEKARHVVLRQLGEVVHRPLALGPEQVVAVMVEERLAQEQRRARHARERLGHERGEDVVRVSRLLHDETGRHDVVGAGHGLGVAKRQAVLRRRHGMVGVLHRNRHLLELEDGVAAQVARGVLGREVEVASVVERRGHGRALLDRRVLLEVEELELGADVQDVAGGIGLAEGAQRAGARVAHEGLAVRGPDVAEDAGHAGLARAPRQNLEGARVREGEHVGLLERGEAVDRRAVEADALLERLLEVLR